jgi:glycosyltransferase involved in cell wall biosynthesis
LPPADYQQVRLFTFFRKGKLFYLEYNLRLFFYLLRQKADILVAIDLDTIVPVYHVSALKGTKRVYDAHELFTEMKEVVSRKHIHRIWRWVERTYLPRFPLGYTVSGSIARYFAEIYGVNYAVIRNLPAGGPMALPISHRKKHFLYQGAVNEGRGFEALIPAMRKVDAPLIIYGEGNYSAQCKALIRQYGVEDRVTMMGAVPPSALKAITQTAYAGINLVEPVGLNQIYSLANKFFDYIQAGIPQVTMAFPEYQQLNEKYGVAVLISDLDPDNIASAMNKVWLDEVTYAEMSERCARAAAELRWEEEELTLLRFYQQTVNRIG